MATLEDLFKTDLDAEESGVWIELGEMSFLIRAFSCKAAVELRDKLQKPYQGILRTPNGKIPEKEAENINLKVLAGAIIADWKGVKDSSETPVAYDETAAFDKMKAMPRFANWVAQQSIDAQNYKNDLTDDSVGN